MVSNMPKLEAETEFINDGAETCLMIRLITDRTGLRRAFHNHLSQTADAHAGVRKYLTAMANGDDPDLGLAYCDLYLRREPGMPEAVQAWWHTLVGDDVPCSELPALD